MQNFILYFHINYYNLYKNFTNVLEDYHNVRQQTPLTTFQFFNAVHSTLISLI